jgi:hypothetical protein
MPDSIRVPVNFTDIRAGIRHDARVAEAEGFKSVAARANELLDILEVAEVAARAKGHYHLDLVFSFPDHLNS